MYFVEESRRRASSGKLISPPHPEVLARKRKLSGNQEKQRKNTNENQKNELECGKESHLKTNPDLQNGKIIFNLN